MELGPERSLPAGRQVEGGYKALSEVETQRQKVSALLMMLKIAPHLKGYSPLLHIM